ncbi:MAG TPA: class I SAM-dependent methyltransferase [Anaerolineae bacterium]|jgi:SAM-dependent methyltransferase
MVLVDSDLDWHDWFERWEAMQNGYIPQRLHRFDLMLQLPDLPCEAQVQILDLGCGAGSLSLRALRHSPNTRVLAVDANPILLAIGQHVAKETTDHIQFLQVDIRQADWWAAYEGTFDLVLSATALHWLSAAHLAQSYRSIYQVLKPGGWFLNSDHIASDHPETQSRYRQMLQANQQAAFRAAGTDDWNGFWQSLAAKLGQPDVQALLGETTIWEGSDDGQPKPFHISVLQECGFEQVEFHWQDLGEAVMGARKPLAR